MLCPSSRHRRAIGSRGTTAVVTTLLINHACSRGRIQREVVGEESAGGVVSGGSHSGRGVWANVAGADRVALAG